MSQASLGMAQLRLRELQGECHTSPISCLNSPKL